MMNTGYIVTNTICTILELLTFMVGTYDLIKWTNQFYRCLPTLFFYVFGLICILTDIVTVWLSNNKDQMLLFWIIT